MKLRVVLLLTITVLLVGGPSGAQSPSAEHYYTYYSDSAFTTWAGEAWLNLNCTGENGSVGTTSSYRKWERFSCVLQDGSCRCQQLINGTWQIIACPPAVSSGCDA